MPSTVLMLRLISVSGTREIIDSRDGSRESGEAEVTTDAPLSVFILHYRANSLSNCYRLHLTLIISPSRLVTLPPL